MVVGVSIIFAMIMMTSQSYSFQNNNEIQKEHNHDSPALFQVILNVKDMQRAVDFYTSILELKLSYPLNIKDFHNVPFVRLESGGMRLSLHKGRSVLNNGQEPRLSFLVNDIKSWEQLLKSKGISLGPIRSPYTGVYVLDCKDPEGNVFHIESHDECFFI